MKCRPGPLRLLGRVEHRGDLASADLLDVAHGLFFDGGQAATDIAFCRLRAHQIDTLALDQLLVIVEEVHGIWRDLRRRCSGRRRCPRRRSTRWSRQRSGWRRRPAAARRRGPTVGLAARPEVVSDSPHLVLMHSCSTAERFARQLGGVLDELHRLARGRFDRLQIAVNARC